MRVLVPLAEGFEEIESITVIDILRRAGLDVVTASLGDNLVKGSHNVGVMTDARLDEVDLEDLDALVLPGGYPGYDNLSSDERIMSLIKRMDRAGRCIGAICMAPSVLLKAGVLVGRKATINPYGRDQLSNEVYVDDRVAVDRNLVTSKSAGTAMEFAIKLVEILAGEEKAREVSEQVLARR